MTTPSELYDLFVGKGAEYEAIASMDLETMAQNIEELRQAPDAVKIYLSSYDIAIEIRDYARAQRCTGDAASCEVVRTVQRFLAKDATYKDLREVVKGGK